VPTPTPELADLFATCHFLTLSRRLRAWAIEKRRPWLHLLFETTKEFFPVRLVGISKDRQAASWLTPRFLHQHRAALIGYETRLKFLDRLPSLQINLNTLDALRRQFACYMLPCNPHFDNLVNAGQDVPCQICHRGSQVLRYIREQHSIASGGEQLQVEHAGKQAELPNVVGPLIAAINPHEQWITISRAVSGWEQKRALQPFAVQAKPIDQDA
jgi:hypothetical protein